MPPSQSVPVKVHLDEKSPLQNGAAHSELGSEHGRYVSEERYWAEYYENSDFPYEWNNGRLEKKPVPDYAQFRLYLWFLGIAKDFLHVTESGRLIGLELGFRMALAQKVTIRKPDLAIVLNTNPIPLLDKDRSYKGIFNVCIESISDSTREEVKRDTIVKWEEYAAAGVQEYYILDERGVETEFYQLSERGVYVPIQPIKGVIHSQVLPGFQFRLADLYRLPEPPQLIEDPVYQGFVSPFLRAERLRAEAAMQRAEDERQRAEHYAGILKAMGIDVAEGNRSS